MSGPTIYPDVSAEDLGQHFVRHLDHMTSEGLHSKFDIARQLAHRDAEIERLTAELAEAKDQRGAVQADCADLESVMRREIAGLTAELAQYREAQIVGWMAPADEEAGVDDMLFPSRAEALHYTDDEHPPIALIARPEAPGEKT